MKKLLSLFLTLLMIATISIPCFADGDENQSTEPGEWFYTDFGFPEEYVREDPQTLKSFGEKLWLPKAPYLVSGFFSLANQLPYKLPDHEKNVEYFKNEAPLILILSPSENAVQYICPEPFTTKNGVTLTQAKVVEILRNDNDEQISIGDIVWVQEDYFWYTNEAGVDVFSSRYGAQCKPLCSGAYYLVQAQRVQEATKEKVFSIGQYFWETSDKTGTGIFFDYQTYKTLWLYSSFWEIEEYKEEVLAHFGLIKSEKTPLYNPFIIGGVAVLTMAVTTVAVIVFTRRRARKKAAPTAD